MRICRWLFTLVALTALARVAQAQVIQEMTPERIREAIALGMSGKDVRPYRIQEKARWSWPPLIGFYTTPFLRVALAANAAKKRYQPFTEADVTPDMIAPEVQVYAPSHDLGGAVIANVVAVVLLPRDSRDASRAIQPTRIQDVTEQYKNLFGYTGEGGGKVASFPLAVWTERYDAHVVFDRPIPSSQSATAMGGCTDCKSHIYLSKIR